MVNIVGLLFNLIGVLLLFRYGMPYRVQTGGDTLILKSDRKDQPTVRLEKRYRRIGWLGLVFIVIGTGFQIYASAM